LFLIFFLILALTTNAGIAHLRMINKFENKAFLQNQMPVAYFFSTSLALKKIIGKLPLDKVVSCLLIITTG
jgi:hypothetical protein